MIKQVKREELYNKFFYEDDIEKIERKIEQLKKIKPHLKTRFKQLITRYNKVNLRGMVFHSLPILRNCVEKIDNLFYYLENELNDLIKGLEISSEEDDFYTYNTVDLTKKGDYPFIWLFHGGYMGGRGVMIKHNQHRETMHPIILEDYKKLDKVKDKRNLTRDDVNPAIERFKKLNFNQIQDNYVNCYNEHLKVDTERKLKIFEERIIETEKKLALIDRDPWRERHLKEYLESAKKYKEQCLETLNIRLKGGE